MADLADDRGRIRLFRAMSGVLAVAVVLAVLEVLVRFNTYDRPVEAPQLAMALFSNVGLTGAGALLLVLVGWLVGSVVALAAGRFRRSVKGVFMSLVPAVGAAALAWSTQTFGLATGTNDSIIALGIAGFVGLIIGLSIWHIGLSRDPSLMNLTRVLVVGVWATCAGGAVFGASKTARRLDEWAKPTRQSVDAEASASSPNLLVVVLDTLRADRVGVYGDSTLTPNLDRLAESSYIYENAISTAPWTLPMHASLLTGLYPEEHGVNWGHYALGEEAPTLGELAREGGYETFAVSNNWLLNEENGFGRGFDRFVETTRDPHLSRWRLALRCGVVGAVAQRFGLSSDAAYDQGSAITNALLSKRFAHAGDSGAPFFALVNYFEAHDPYRPPERFVKKHLSERETSAYRRLEQGEESLAACACGLPGIFDDADVALMKRLYDAEVAYQDEVVGELVAMLDRGGLLDTTWLVVTSDHGELFGEWDMVYHTASSHYKLLHVPLLVRPPGGVDQTRIPWPAQPVDIFVTLAEAAGLAIPSTVTKAYPLATDADEPGKREVCVAQTHGASLAGLSMTQRRDLRFDLTRWMRWYDSVYADGFMLEMDSAGGRRLFDVAGDPGMDVDVAAEQMERVYSLERRFEDWSGRAPTRVTLRR